MAVRRMSARWLIVFVALLSPIAQTAAAAVK
jgi:hypothetical protein